jgi:hypothetical protein
LSGASARAALKTAMASAYFCCCISFSPRAIIASASALGSSAAGLAKATVMDSIAHANASHRMPLSWRADKLKN